jgi:threonine dehydratase
MPVGVALPKLDATRSYGADVVLRGNSIGETMESAAAFAAETGAVLIPPFDHPDVIAGQGTLGLEILEQAPDATTIVVPIGGGGLAAGIASAAKQQAAREGRPLRIVGVQAENAAPYIASLAAGEPRQVPVVPTIADGIAVYRPGELNFAIIRDTVDEVVTVSEDDIARALLVLLERAKLVVEPAGAVAVAAIMTGAVKSDGPVVAVLSGGNIDPLLMQRVVAHGLAASDRYLTLSIGLPDRPGQLARVAELLAEANANVIEVLHTRHGSGLQISEVELQLSVETRGPEHRASVVEVLRHAGYDPRVVDGE